MTDNSGLKVGLGMTAIGTATALSVKPMVNRAYKSIISNARKNFPPEDAYEIAKPLFEAHKTIKGTKFFKPMLIAIPMYLGFGAIVDWANKKQRTNSEPNAQTKNGNAYTKVNMGKKLGAVLGIAGYAIAGLANKAQMKKILTTSPNKFVSVAITAISGALGGFILGSITDKISNKKAAKVADQAAK